MRASLFVLAVVLLAPVGSAGPVDDTDCDDRDPAVTAAQGCSAYAVVYDPTTGAWTGCGLDTPGAGFAGAGCFAVTKAGSAGATCYESRWNSDPYSEDSFRACGAGVGDASGAGTYVACSSSEHRGPRQTTSQDCGPVGLSTAGCAPPSGASPNGACAAQARGNDVTYDWDMDLACADAGPACGTSGGAHARNTTGGFFDIDYGCALSGSATDVDVGCGDSIATGDLDGDGAPDVACASSLERDPAGRRGVTGGCGGSGMRATQGGAGGPLGGLAGRAAVAMGTAAGWTGGCDHNGGAGLACDWWGPAGSGAVEHRGLPPTHSNLVVADLDRDGAPDVMLAEERGSAVFVSTLGGCTTHVATGGAAGGAPSAKTCLG